PTVPPPHHAVTSISWDQRPACLLAGRRAVVRQPAWSASSVIRGAPDVPATSRLTLTVARGVNVAVPVPVPVVRTAPVALSTRRHAPTELPETTTRPTVRADDHFTEMRPEVPCGDQ